MGSYTHETVPTQFVEADGIRYAYCRFMHDRRKDYIDYPGFSTGR